MASTITRGDADPPITPGGEQLRRTLTLPWLVFYGVGVTVGAGIFALIGELLGASGVHAPLAFLVAGTIAGLTGLSYMALVRTFPKASGEAVWVAEGLGPRAGRAAGLGIITAGTISSAVVALAFGGYLGELVDIPAELAAVMVIAALAAVACRGVKESVLLAGVVTLLEVGTLVLVIVFGLPDLVTSSAVVDAVRPDGDVSGFATAVMSGAIVAFFAFIGFEDIVHMAEETVDAERTAPRAIAWTLGISITIYVVLALIAVSIDDPSAIEQSDAPMATLFETLTGRGADIVATIAAIAMTNGILAQMMMAARVVYGMTHDDLDDGEAVPILGRTHPRWQTPVAATLLVAATVTFLVLLVPLVELARTTSVVILTVFTLVNLSVVRLGGRDLYGLRRWRPVALTACALAAPLAVWQAVDAVQSFT